MPKRYDPLLGPDPVEWLAAAEAERIRRVERFHRAARLEMPSVTAHAAVHVVVENQAALGDETPVAAALDRLIGEGLDRHDAVHAIGAVFARHYFEVMKGGATREPGTLRAEYFDDVRTLTAAAWRAAFEPD